MTCIVGLIDEMTGNVIIGGDSAGVGGLDLTARKDSKVFQNGEFIMGFTTSFRMGQVLRFGLKPTPIPEDVDLYEYMVVTFTNDVRKAFKDAGVAHRHNEVETGGSFLVGVRGRLFHVQSDFQVGENIAPFAACGCGDAYALGAMEVLQAVDMDPVGKVEKALATAVAWSAGVRPPFNVIVLPPKIGPARQEPSVQDGDPGVVPQDGDPWG